MNTISEYTYKGWIIESLHGPKYGPRSWIVYRPRDGDHEPEIAATLAEARAIVDAYQAAVRPVGPADLGAVPPIRKPYIINAAHQEVQYRRLELCDYPGGDCRITGKAVAGSLRANQGLWDAFVFGRPDWGQLIELRNMLSGKLSADTVHLLTDEDRLPVLLQVIAGWRADEVNVYTGKLPSKVNEMYGAELNPGQALIRVWWD